VKYFEENICKWKWQFSSFFSVAFLFIRKENLDIDLPANKRIADLQNINYSLAFVFFKKEKP
jgi:hypothetical protein